MVSATDDAQRGRPHARQSITCEIRPAAARYNGRNFGGHRSSGDESGGSTRARAEETNWKLGGLPMTAGPSNRLGQSRAKQFDIEDIGPADALCLR